MKLGGWHRLWLVLALVWIAGTGFIFWSSRQPADELYHGWANELIAYLIENSSELRGYTEASVRSTYSDITDQQLVEALHEKYLPQHPAYSYGFAEIDAKYRPRLESLDSASVPADVWWWVLVAFGVPVGAYGIGAAIAWVLAGFRRA